mgnify:FL=1
MLKTLKCFGIVDVKYRALFSVLLVTFSHMGADAWMACMGAPSRGVAEAALERHMHLSSPRAS